MNEKLDCTISKHPIGETICADIGGKVLEVLIGSPYLYTSIHSDCVELRIDSGLSGSLDVDRPEALKRRLPDFRVISMIELTQLFKRESRGASLIMARLLLSTIIAGNSLRSIHVDETTRLGQRHFPHKQPETDKEQTYNFLGTDKYVTREGDDLVFVEENESLLTVTQDDAFADRITRIDGEYASSRFNIARGLRNSKSEYMDLRELDRANPDLTEFLFGSVYEDIPTVLRRARFSIPPDGRQFERLSVGLGVALENKTYAGKDIHISPATLFLRDVMYAGTSGQFPVLVKREPGYPII